MSSHEDRPEVPDDAAAKARDDANARWSQHPTNDAWAIISYLLSGMAVYGGAGWLLDAWLGTGFFLPTGLLLGAGAALYLIWVRYGKA